MDLSYIHPAGGNPVIAMNFFYNGPVTPAGTWNVMMDVPHIANTYQEGIAFNSFLNDKIGGWRRALRSLAILS